MSIKYINSYNTTDEYSADVKPTDGSSVNSVQSVQHYDGVNVFVASPNVGDIVCIDSSKSIKYIKSGTANISLLPSDYQYPGVVGYRFGNKVMVVHRTNVDQKWADVYRWTVAGWSGYTSAITVTLNNVSYGTFTPSAGHTTASAFVADFNTFLSTKGVTTYHMYVESISGTDTPVLVFEPYTSHPGTTTLSGLTLAIYNGTEYDAGPSLMRMNGIGGEEGPIMNLDRAIACYTNDNGAAYYQGVPSSTITGEIGGYPVGLPSYLGTSKYSEDRCAWLRNKYGEGYAGWLNYLNKSILAKPLTEYGGTKWMDGKTLTYAHAGKKYINASGVSTAAYPAFEYCAAVNYDATGLEQGNWFLPSLYQMTPIWSQLKYGTNSSRTSDPINAGLLAIGGTALSNGSGAWCGVRDSSGSAWLFSGGSGFVSSSYFCGRRLAVPCLLLKI